MANKKPMIAGRTSDELKERHDNAMRIQAAIEKRSVTVQDAVEEGAIMYCEKWEKKVKTWKPGKI